MVFSIIKQSIDIRLGFPKLPKISADTECIAVIGMLAKLYQLPLPKRRKELARMQGELAEKTKDLPASEEMEKLEQMLYAYEPKKEVDDEKYELMKYCYEQT